MQKAPHWFWRYRMGARREASLPPAARGPLGTRSRSSAEFTSSAEISSDWLPRIQAEELWSPFLALLGSSHNQVMERAGRKTFLCVWKMKDSGGEGNIAF